MMQRLFALLLMIAPALSFAQESAAPAAPIETPWGAMIGFVVVCLAIGGWTVWAVFFKKDDDDKTNKD